MKTTLGMEFEIDFSHTLNGHPKCGQPHGHTARILIEIEGDVKNGSNYKDNMIMDFDEMNKICWEKIKELDHKDLNSMFDFPTSENISMWIFKNLENKIPISSVKFYEGSRKWCYVEK